MRGRGFPEIQNGKERRLHTLMNRFQKFRRRGAISLHVKRCALTQTSPMVCRRSSEAYAETDAAFTTLT